MRWTKALGLAALAAVAAMAFVGTGTASAQHKIVICKELVALCPNGKLWPSGSKLLFLAPGNNAEGKLLPEPTLLGNLNVKCEDSLGTAVTAAEIGSPLGVSITTLAFGKLPTPSLGVGCTNCSEVHVTLPIAGQIEVEAIDKYFLKATGEAKLLNCIGLGIECVFKGTNIKVPILHTGGHDAHKPATNLPLIEFNEVKLERTGGSAFCGSEGKWDADYVVYLVDPPVGEPGLGWPSLDQ